MKFIRKHGPIALGIVALLFVLGLVGETPDERSAMTAHTEEMIDAAREASLAKERDDEWKNLVAQGELFTPRYHGQR